MALGDGRTASADLLALVREHSREAQVFDMATGRARERHRDQRGAVRRDRGERRAAAAARGVRGDDPRIRQGRRRQPARLRARRSTSSRPCATSAARSRPRSPRRRRRRRAEATGVERRRASTRAIAAFPADVRELVALGHARLVDYQDRRYAELYLERLGRVLAAERAGDPGDANGHGATRAAARWLALWMAFDDVVRVADLKTRAARFARVEREVKAERGDVRRDRRSLQARRRRARRRCCRSASPPRCVRWERRRVARGREPFALPLKIRSDTVFGFLAPARPRRDARAAPARQPLRRRAGGDRALARRRRGRGAPPRRARRRDRRVRPADQGLRRDQRARQGEPAATSSTTSPSRAGSRATTSAPRRSAPPASPPSPTSRAPRSTRRCCATARRRGRCTAQPIRWVSKRPGRPVEVAARSSEPAP